MRLIKDNRRKKPDFFNVIRFDKFKGIKEMRLMDSMGDYCNCLVIPMVKNGIVREGKHHLRMILSAFRQKSSCVAHVTHALVPFLTPEQYSYIKRRFYETNSPIVGDVMDSIDCMKYDINDSERNEESIHDTEMSRAQVLRSIKGKTFKEATGKERSERATDNTNTASEDFKQTMREKLLALSKSEQ